MVLGVEKQFPQPALDRKIHVLEIILPTMLEEIKYWELDSWLEYLRDNIVPLRDLGLKVSELLVPDPLGDRAKQIAKLADDLIRHAQAKFNVSLGSYQVTEEDALEVARMFLEKAINTTAGCNKHTFFAWSLRKITRSYLELQYPELKDPEKLRSVMKIMGLTEYWKPPPVKSKIVEGYVCYAVPDYCSLITKVDSSTFRISMLPEASPTLAGSICKLNEELWDLASEKPGLAAAYEFPDIWTDYKSLSDKVLSKAGWSDPKSIIYAGNYKNIADVESDYWYKFEGLGVTKIYYYSGEKRSKYSIFEFWDTLMPPLFLGKYEFVMDENRRLGIIYKRW